MPDAQPKYVSIIIPTYNDWARLSLCIAALSGQTYPADRFEVIVVNNDPDDAPPANFWLPENCRLIEERKPGSYAARNAALQIARGEILGFTDSDCIPDKDWIKNAVAYLEQVEDCHRLAGHISIFSNAVSRTVGEIYDKVYAFPQKMYAEKFKTGVTGNLFTYRKVFEAVGNFDANLFSAGDFEWGMRAHKAGHRVHFVKNVIVNHPARNLNELIKKERRVGGGKGMTARRTAVKFSHVVELLKGFKPRIAEIRHIYKTDTGLNAIDKMKVLILRHYLLNVRAFEKLRVHMGKKPNRT